MIPVDQTKFGPEEGNCFTACLASILELPIENVPDFADGPDSTFHRRVNRWLNTLGYWMHSSSIDNDKTLFNEVLRYAGYTIINGDSPRFANTRHSVVFYKAHMVHDPSKDRLGLKDNLKLEINTIVPIEIKNKETP